MSILTGNTNIKYGIHVTGRGIIAESFNRSILETQLDTLDPNTKANARVIVIENNSNNILLQESFY